MERYGLLAALAAVWCALHSLLISPMALNVLHRRLGTAMRFYRLTFNAVAVVTLAPVVCYAMSLRTAPFFSWHGSWRLIQIPLLAASLALFVCAARRYDARRFFGIAQIGEARVADGGLGDAGALDTSGILAVVRHPWYLAGFLLLWGRDIDTAALVVNVIFSMYLVVGALLEEKKLVKEFGAQYIAYRQHVPMFVPYMSSKSKKIG